MNEKRIIEKLKNGDESEVYQLYAYQPMVIGWMKKHNGAEEEARDLFQEALFVFIKNVKSGKYEHKSKISTYLVEICKRQWYKKIRDNRETYVEEPFDSNEKADGENDGPSDQSLKDYVKGLLLQVGDTCRKLIIARFYENAKWEKDYARLGYNSAHSARQQFSVCMSKLRGGTSYDDLIVLE